MSKVPFSKYKTEILEAVQKLKDDGYFPDADSDLTLNPTFSMIPSQLSIGDGIELGTTTPAICVVSKKTGRLYFFSLKVLLPQVFDEAFGG